MKKPYEKPARVKVCITLLPENYRYIYAYLKEEEDRGLSVNFSRAINALISQVRLGTAEVNEIDFNRRKRPLRNAFADLIEKLPAEKQLETIKRQARQPMPKSPMSDMVESLSPEEIAARRAEIRQIRKKIADADIEQENAIFEAEQDEWVKEALDTGKPDDVE